MLMTPRATVKEINATMADAFSILASWEGHRVVVDSREWIPPLLPETDGGVQ